jgi:hypothetical protein
MTLSPTAYARHRKAPGLPGGTHVAVLKAIKAGRIEAEPDGSIDPTKADAAWSANTDAGRRRASPREVDREEPPAAPARVATGRAGSADTSAPLVGGPSYAQSRAIREAYAARLAKLDYEERSGALVRTERVKVGWFNALRVVRDRILNLPDRLAPLLAAESDERRAREMLVVELRTVLADVAGEVSRLGSSR